MKESLTLEVWIAGEWQSAAQLEFPEPAKGAAGTCEFAYEFDYLARFIGNDVPLSRASQQFPVEFDPKSLRRWPAFLDDLRPMGSARRWWLQRLGLHDEPASDLRLLREGTIAPVGNLRVREAVPPKDAAPQRFPRQAVVEREQAFIEYAARAGASVGGATGAGGDSPKLLLRLTSEDQVWIDTWQDEPENQDGHVLVKFARGRDERNRLILRAEHVYYRALHALGIETISQQGMTLDEGPGGPSLWLPRFDVVWREGRQVRCGLESIYSLVGATPGAFLTHQQVLAALRSAVSPEDWPAAQLEYVKRDLCNLVFGNSDNHGRNSAILRTESGVQLAPVYDFAPMQIDLEGIIRTTRWDGFERGGEINWPGLLGSFGSDERRLRDGLRQFANELRRLPELLEGFGLPREVLEWPSLDLRGTEKKLRAWSLL